MCPRIPGSWLKETTRRVPERESTHHLVWNRICIILGATGSHVADSQSLFAGSIHKGFLFSGCCFLLYLWGVIKIIAKAYKGQRKR